MRDRELIQRHISADFITSAFLIRPADKNVRYYIVEYERRATQSDLIAYRDLFTSQRFPRLSDAIRAGKKFVSEGRAK